MFLFGFSNKQNILSLCCNEGQLYCIALETSLSSSFCSVLQCVAVCCSVLQCAAVCCSVLQCAAVRARYVESRPKQSLSSSCVSQVWD